MTNQPHYEMIDHPEFWGRCMFAESFRMELEGQYSLVGCYIGGISVEDFPARLPKLALFIEAALNPSANISSVTYRAYMPGADQDSHFWETEQHVRNSAEDGEVDDGRSDDYEDAQIINGPFPAPPVTRLFTAVNNALLEVPQAGDIRVRAFVGNKVYPLGSIAVAKIEKQVEG
ncbi:MAG: hypothetical protein ACK4NU_02575 [Brevundimonas sp.]